MAKFGSTVVALACMIEAVLAASDVSQPNIILIVADDLGYGDLGCYGSPSIATPALDRMAAEGMRFTDFYVAAPFCSPSRAALLTGRLPARCGVPYVLFPAEHTGLPLDELTIPELLRDAGYATACVGKWHLGWRREFRPTRQGFDEYYGLLHTNDSDEWKAGSPFGQLTGFEPVTLREGDEVVEQPVDQAMLTEKYTLRAIDVIRRHCERPFFLYLAHTMPHVPQYASPAFAGKSGDGLYGDCVEELDSSVGRILDELRIQGLADRTFVVFLSDNGASGRSATAPRKAKSNPRFPGRAFGGSNAPLRGGKGSTWEGGVRVPCLAWWPNHIAAGRVESTPCTALDFLPTCAAIAKSSVPAGLILDGEDISELLKASGSNREDPPRFITHYFGVQLQAVREGRWKLLVPIAAAPAIRQPSLWFDHQAGLFERQHRLWPAATLYDLATDPYEREDVASRYPSITSRLQQRAITFDSQFQKVIRARIQLAGPTRPEPGQVRKETDDISGWIELLR